MKTILKGILTMVLLLLLVSCIAIPAALAAPAENAWVNGVQLTSSLPYWKNGGTTASATEPKDWNAYFNAPTGTLTLKNAVINKPASYVLGDGLVCADGDLSLVLSGASTISWNNNTHEYIYGILVNGALAISGDGSINIQMLNTHASGAVTAVLNYGNLTVASGRISCTLEAVSTAHGLYSARDVLIAGGQAVINAKASGVTGVSAINSEFRMADGSVMVNAEGTDGTGASDVYALFCSQASLEGGTGSFTSYGTARYLSGVNYSSNTLSYSGGTFTFAGTTSALLNYGSSTSIHYILNDAALVYASKSLNGSAPIQWKSDADGILTSLLLVPSMSEFHYVKFTQPVIQPPRTGDESHPWLWVGIGAAVVLLAAGAVLIVRRKRR